MKVISEMKTKLQDTQWNRFKQKFNKWYRKKVENSQDNGNEVKKGEKEKMLVMEERQWGSNLHIIGGPEQEKETSATYLIFKILIQYYFPETIYILKQLILEKSILDDQHWDISHKTIWPQK